MKKVMILVAMVGILFSSCNFIEDLLGIKDDDKKKKEIIDTTEEKTEEDTDDTTEETAPDLFPGMTRHDLDTAGGTIVSESGDFTITIPEAAVPANTALYLKTLSAAETPAADASRVLFALHGEVVTGTETFTGFTAPITLSIPAPTLEPGDFVMIREFDPVRKVYLPSTHSYTIDRVGKTINLEVSHFSAITAEVIAELKRAENECKDPATSCRCGKVHVESDNDDYSCTKDGVVCFVLRDFVEVQFLDCPGTPVESASLAQISPNCQPSMTMTASALVVEQGDTVDLEALFQLGCAPFKGKNVTFAVSGPGTLQKTTEVTDTKGKAQNKVTATSTGTIEVSVTGTADYWEQEEIINGEVQVQEGYHNVNETAAVTIEVVDKPKMSLSVYPYQVAIDEIGWVNVELSRGGIPLSGQTVSFSISGTASLISSSAVTDSNGWAYVEVIGQSEGTAEITASCIVVCENSSGTVNVPVSAMTTMKIGSGPYLETRTPYTWLQGGEHMSVWFMLNTGIFGTESPYVRAFDYTVSVSGPGIVDTPTGSATEDEYGGSADFKVTAENETGTIILNITATGTSNSGTPVTATEQIQIPVTKTPIWHGMLTYQSPQDLDHSIWKWYGADLLIDFVFDEPFRWRDSGSWSSSAKASCTAFQSLNGLTATDYTAYNGLILGDLTHTFTQVSAFEPTTLYFELKVISSSYNDWLEFDFDLVAGDNERATLYYYEFHEYYEGVSEYAGPVHGESDFSFTAGGLQFFIPNLPEGEVQEGTYDIYAFRDTPSYNLNMDIYRDSIQHWYGGEEFSCTLELELVD